MQYIRSTLAAGIAAMALTQPVSAADLKDGANSFKANCSECHAKGGNVVQRSKTLKKVDLEKNDRYSQGAITELLKKGVGACPSFARKLPSNRIENIAAYVMDQADHW